MKKIGDTMKAFRAEKCMRFGDFEVERIIDYLRQTLDMKYEVAQDFENIYSYLSQRLIEANISKDAEILEEINTHLRSVRDTWKEVMKLNGYTAHI